MRLRTFPFAPALTETPLQAEHSPWHAAPPPSLQKSPGFLIDHPPVRGHLDVIRFTFPTNERLLPTQRILPLVAWLSAILMCSWVFPQSARGEDTHAIDPPVLDFTELDVPWLDMPNSGGDFLDAFTFGPHHFLIHASGAICRIPSDGTSLEVSLILPLEQEWPMIEYIIATALSPCFEETGFLFTLSMGQNVQKISRWEIQFGADFIPSANGGPTLVYKTEFHDVFSYRHSRRHGGLAFGPDGMLYAAFPMGDTNSDLEHIAQDLASPLGKILRLHVHDPADPAAPYSIPEDNPFIDEEEALPEIWALGLHSPASMVFDPATGDLLITDSGLEGRAELNRLTADTPGGANFGWPFWDGTIRTEESPDTFPLPDHPVFPEIETVETFHHSIRLGFITAGQNDDARMDELLIFGQTSSRHPQCARFVGDSWITEQLDALPGAQVGKIRQLANGRIFIMGFKNGRIWEAVPAKRAIRPIITVPTSFPANAVDVTFTTRTLGARIHYTIDGSDPGPHSASVASGESVQVDGIQQVRAVAIRPDLDPSQLDVYGGFSFNVAPIRLSYLTNVFAGQALVTLATDTEGAIIRYSTEGADPLQDGIGYSGPFLLRSGANLKLAGSKPGYRDALDQPSIRPDLVQPADTTVFAGSASETGAGDGHRLNARFLGKLGLAMDSTDRLLIADESNHRIRRVDHEGTVSTLAGSVEGFLDGPVLESRFRRPLSLVEAADGSIYIADHGNQALRKITTDGMVSTVATAVGSIRQVFLSPQGEVHWSGWGEIRKMLPDGSHIRIAGTGVSNSNFLSGETWPVWHDEAILVSSRSGLKRIDANGVLERIASNRIAPSIVGNWDGPVSTARHFGSGIARDTLGNIYLARSNHIGKLRAIDNWIVTVGESFGTATMEAIAVASDGTIYTSPGYGRVIHRIIQSDWDDDGVPDEIERMIPGLTVGVNDLETPAPDGGLSAALHWMTGGLPFQLAIGNSAEGIDLHWPQYPHAEVVVESSTDLKNWKIISGLTNASNDVPLIFPKEASQVLYRMQLFPAR